MVRLTPSKIICVGRNYAAHARELGNDVPKSPLIFLKPPSSVIADGDAIELPSPDVTQRVEYEAEIAVVIGQRVRHATPAQARASIEGVTCANDVTARDLQNSDGQWTRAKGFDTFCALGPRVLSLPADYDLSSLEVMSRVNGVQKQHGKASDMVFPIATLVAFISGVMTLEKGDVVLTGTPDGVGPLVAGDTVEIEIKDVGVLRNPVRKGGRG